MPRGPDWLLGFGFKAKDNGLVKYLQDAQKQLQGLNKAMKDFQKTSSGSSGASAAGGGVDTSRLSKSLSRSSRTSMLRGMESLNKEVSTVLHNVDKGLEHVNRTGRDIGLVLHRNILKLFDDLDKGSLKTMSNLEQIPEVLLKIPLLTTKTSNSLRELHKTLVLNGDDHETMLRTMRRLRKEITKSVQEASGYEDIEKGVGGAYSKVGEFLRGLTSSGDMFKKTWESGVEGIEMFSSILDKRLPGVSKRLGKLAEFGEQSVGEAVKKASARVKGLEESSIAAVKDFSSVFKKKLQPITDRFSKRFAVPITRLGKMFARVPLINRLFGKRQQLSGMRRDLDRIAKDTGEFNQVAEFNKAHGTEFTAEQFEEMLKGEQLELEMRMADAFEKLSTELPQAEEEAAEAAVKSAISAMQGSSGAGGNIANQVAEAVSDAADRMDASGQIENSLKELVSKIHYDVTPAVADELGALVNVFAHGKNGIISETSQMERVVSTSFNNLMTHSIGRLPTALDEAFLSAKHHVENFGTFLNEWIGGAYSNSFTQFRERVTRSARVFDKLRERASSAFTNILLEKELFVQKFEDNFRRLSGDVGNSVSKISVVTEQEFRQMEADLRATYSNLGTISRAGVEQQSEAISRGFGKLGGTLSRVTGPIVENYEALGKGLKKAVGLNPFPVLGVLSKLGPMLARVGPAAARAIPGMEGLGEAAAARGGAQGLGAKEQFGEFLKQHFVEKGMGDATSGVMDRIQQLSSMIRGEHKEEMKGAKPAQSSESSIVAIVDAINSMSSRLSAQLSKMSAAAAKAPEGGGVVAGKLSVDSDEMKKVFSTTLSTIKGLAGMAR